jgi:hypothetical protein
MRSPHNRKKQEDVMEGNGNQRVWVNRIVAFLGGGLLTLLVLSIAVTGPANNRNKMITAELDQIRNGAPRLLAEARAFADSKDYVNTLKTLDVLFVQQPVSTEAVEGRKLYAATQKTILDGNTRWDAAMVSIRSAWEKTTAAQLREQARTQVESDMTDTLAKEWDKAKDQIRRDWEERKI